MTQFHEGDEVEVWDVRDPGTESLGTWKPVWRKAKIIVRTVVARHLNQYEVQLRDGPRAVFDAEYIRTVNPDFEHAPESKPGGGFL